MLHTDFEFYIESFHGSVFKDVSEFTAAEVKASAFVDNFILNPEALNIPTSAERCRFAICAVAELVYNESKSASNSSSMGITSDTNEIFTFPYKSSVKTTLSLVDYIGYTADNSDGGTVTYLTPEDFGAIGDGYTDDSLPISLCLAEAEKTNQTVLMAKRYYVTLPIEITQSGLNIIVNDVKYSGNDIAVKIYGRYNVIKIHSIDSNGIGVGFFGNGTSYGGYHHLEVNLIKSLSHGIVFYTSNGAVQQNAIYFNHIQAGGTGCYGIAYLKDDNSYIAENRFYCGQISNCEWASYLVGGNSTFYSPHIESNVQGGFYFNNHCTVFSPRITESSRDGNLPILKFKSAYGVNIYNHNGSIAFNEIDLSDNTDVFNTNIPLHENRLGVINSPIAARFPGTGMNEQTAVVYARKAYVWGKYLIMQPFMEYRKAVTTATLDTRLIGRADETDEEIKALSQLPTKFVIDNINTEIYLHSSYCAFGYKDFEVEQANGFTCKVYDVLNNLLFDGTDKGNGIYKFKVYKDSDRAVEYGNGLLRRDFLGHFWEIERRKKDIV